MMDYLGKGFNCNAKALLLDYVYHDWTKDEFIEGGYTYPTPHQGNSR